MNMEEDVFYKKFGTKPIEKKRSKRSRSCDEFEQFEQTGIIKDDPFDIYSFSSQDNVLNGAYIPLGESTVISSSRHNIFSEYYDISDIKEDSNLKNFDLSGDQFSPNINDDTTQSMECIDEVQYGSELSDIKDKLTQIIDNLRVIESTQMEIIQNGNITLLQESLNKLHSQLSILNEIQAFLKQNISNRLLTPQDFDLTWILEDEILSIQCKTNVLINEINHINNPNHVYDLAYLIISKQPFPKSVKQNKPLKEDIVVELITASTCICNILGDTKAEVMSNFQTKNKTQSMAQNNRSKMVDNKAVFNNIIFPFGTRKRTISLKFYLEVEISHPYTNKKQHFHLESLESRPVIVKTNENQWEESEGILLKNETFKDQQLSTWFHFINSLQRRYLMATKQSLLFPIRPLTIDDFDYIYKVKFNTGNTKINVQQFDSFWQWFGPGLHKIRYQRHMCNLWVKGYICGFLPRGEAESILRDLSPGTFLMRLSERMNGTFTIAYTIIEHGIKKVYHYIINSDDVFGAKKTLPDFLGNELTLTKLVKVSIYDEQKKKYEVISKDDALREFYSKKSASELDTDGYDRKIIRTLNS